MHIAGSPSWEVTETGGDLRIHHALFVRDALGLETSDHEVPSLLGEVRNRSELLLGADAARVACAWAKWWDEVIAVQASANELGVEAGEQTGSTVRAETFLTPADPVLSRAAEATRSDAESWFAGERHKERMAHRAAFPDRRGIAARRAAEDTAARLGVSPNELRAFVYVILVEGAWWHRSAPAVLLCSPAARADDDEWHTALCETFASSLKT